MILLMRVCILSHLFPTRSETFVRGHAIGLATRGYEVMAIARSAGSDMSDAESTQLQDAGIQQFHVGLPASRRLILPEYCRQIVRQGPWVVRFSRGTQWSLQRSVESVRYLESIQRLHPDVVHVHFGDLGARMARLGRCSRFPIPDIVTWHGYEATILPNVHGQGMYLDLFNTSCIHTVGSSFMRDRLLELGANPDIVRVIPMGIDLSHFAYQERDLSGILRVLSVGRLDQMKGHHYLIEAVERLRSEGISVELRIIGDGPLRQELDALIKKLDLNDQIQLMGAMDSDAVAKWMSQAHVFALSGVMADNGRVETQGVVFAEAQATGLPVIACDVGGVRDSLLDGKTGFLCRQRDVEAIANKLAFFNNNREQIVLFGTWGRAFVESRFSQTAMLDEFESLYREALENQLHKTIA